MERRGRRSEQLLDENLILDIGCCTFSKPYPRSGLTNMGSGGGMQSSRNVFEALGYLNN